MRNIAIYGKGGIGKSTVSSNISVAIAEMGYRVMQIGCDPKADSTKNLRQGNKIPSVLELGDKFGLKNLELEQIVHKGYADVYCLEAGGPEPGVGCAGRGVISVLEYVNKLEVYEELDIDVVIFDVLGDVVCGGFAVPLRAGYAEHVYEVTSGEIMALYAANNIARALKRFGQRGSVRLGGLICNLRNAYMEKETVSGLAERLNSRVTSFVPRDNVVQECELRGKTVMEGAPDSNQAEHYRTLAKSIMENEEYVVPTPMTDDEFERFIESYHNLEPA